MWIIYFCCYVASLGSINDSNISGRILIEKDSIETYIRPYQYVKWKIDSVEKNNEEGFEGIYYLSRPYGKSILKLTDKDITQIVVFEKDDFIYTNTIYSKTPVQVKK